MADALPLQLYRLRQQLLTGASLAVEPDDPAEAVERGAQPRSLWQPNASCQDPGLRL
ncbi:MAG TPA: hypothetical protein VER55_11210 [Ardenticatenaceae bacterium]|nr:hypothetical protein [Ardenticatenaceae bacterium]